MNILSRDLVLLSESNEEHYALREWEVESVEVTDKTTVRLGNKLNDNVMTIGVESLRHLTLKKDCNTGPVKAGRIAASLQTIKANPQASASPDLIEYAVRAGLITTEETQTLSAATLNGKILRWNGLPPFRTLSPTELRKNLANATAPIATVHKARKKRFLTEDGYLFYGTVIGKSDSDLSPEHRDRRRRINLIIAEKKDLLV